MTEECKIYPVIVTEMDLNSAENPPPPPTTRRHSLSDKPNTTKRRVPIYLRASTGSCHDFCKFGRHPIPEEETRESFRKRSWKSSPNLAYFMQLPVSDNKQKPNHKILVKDSLKVTTSPNKLHMTVSGGKNQKKHSPTLSRDKTIKSLQNLSLGNKSSNVPREILQPSQVVEVSVEEGSSSNGNKMSRGDKKMSVKQQHSSLVKVKGKNMTSLESPSPRSYFRKTAPNKAREAGRVKSTLSSTPPTKCQDRIAEFDNEAAKKDMLKPKARKPSSPLSRRKVKQDSEKTLHVIKTEAENSIEENEGIQNTVSIETGDIQTMEGNHSHEEGGEEGIYLPSSLQASSSSLEENDKQMKEGDSVSESLEPQKGKGMSRKTRLVHSEDKDSSPVKLNFRRGKIIDLQLENNVPKKLKFRRRRNKSADFASDLTKPNRTLRRAKSDKKSMDVKPGTPNRNLRKSPSTVCENNSSDFQTGRSDLRKNDVVVKEGEAEEVEVVSSKVVLKHQEMEMKHSNDGVLLNNVIEETASKLVESRVSKVKALVGAFETVISLQER